MQPANLRVNNIKTIDVNINTRLIKFQKQFSLFQKQTNS